MCIEVVIVHYIQCDARNMWHNVYYDNNCTTFDGVDYSWASPASRGPFEGSARVYELAKSASRYASKAVALAAGPCKTTLVAYAQVQSTIL